MINVKLKGDVRQFEAGVSAADVARSIGMGLYKSACAARVNGEVWRPAHRFERGLHPGDPHL